MLKRVLTVAVAASIALGGALPAFADEDFDEAPVENSNFDYAADEHILLYSVDGDCTLTDDLDVTFDVAEDGTITFEVGDSEPSGDADGTAGFGDTTLTEDGSEDEALPPLDGCTAISVEGPNGQVNHGTVVSNLVKALKAMDLDIPLGQALKAVAQSDLGKGDQKVKTKDAKNDADDDAEDSDGEDDDDEDGDESKSKKDKKEKKDKSDKASKSNNGKGKNK